MMDLINRKHNKRRCKRVHAMEVQESTFDRLNKRHSELSDRGQVQQKGKNRSRKFMQKVSTKHYYASTPKIQISTKLYRASNVPEQQIDFYRSASRIGWQLQPVCESQLKANRHEVVKPTKKRSQVYESFDNRSE